MLVCRISNLIETKDEILNFISLVFILWENIYSSNKLWLNYFLRFRLVCISLRDLLNRIKRSFVIVIVRIIRSYNLWKYLLQRSNSVIVRIIRSYNLWKYLLQRSNSIQYWSLNFRCNLLQDDVSLVWSVSFILICVRL